MKVGFNCFIYFGWLINWSTDKPINQLHNPSPQRQSSDTNLFAGASILSSVGFHTWEDDTDTWENDTGYIFGHGG